ncbi:hypothetical protein ACFWBF_08350 [Streptomyces sp. NPDC060028]|uniref:hypothetical protein n=1 Tax=Streptomyces sp. NPDC060028 TaxID=3347041 RepID=UPI0036785C95
MSATSWATVVPRRAVAAAAEGLPLHDTRDSAGADRALVARSPRRPVTAPDSAI